LVVEVGAYVFENDPDQNRPDERFRAYVCCDCFGTLFGEEATRLCEGWPRDYACVVWAREGMIWKDDEDNQR